MALPILTAELAEKYTISPAGNALVGRDPDRLITIGDPEADVFTPRMSLGRWGEISIRLDAPSLGTGKATVSFQGNKVIWKRGFVEARFYDKSDDFEAEIVFAGAPPSNVIQFPLSALNGTWAHQPPLDLDEPCPWNDEVTITPTHAYDSEGGISRYRPERCVNSYALLADGHRHGDYSKIGGKNYRDGRGGTLYRSKVTDALGISAWCNQEISNGILSITIPQNFLNSATYPVILDPTFGHTTEESSHISVQKQTTVVTRTLSGELPSSSGTLTYMYIHGYLRDGTPDFCAGLYDDQSGPDPNNRLDYTDTGPLWTATETWYTATMPGCSISSSTYYWLGYASFVTTGRYYVSYVSASNAGRQKSSQTSWANPWDIAGDSASNTRPSLYAEYSESATVTVDSWYFVPANPRGIGPEVVSY